MKVLTSIFTREPNLPYFQVCLEHLAKNNRKTMSELTTFLNIFLTIDFSPRPSQAVETLVNQYNGRYNSRPNRGFGSNFNAATHFAVMNGFDYMLNINDDAFISESFLTEGLKIIESDPKIGMVAGICPKRGRWRDSPKNVQIPEPTDELIEVDPLTRLWWECSGSLYRVEALVDTGKWDEFYDTGGGVIGDNDYYIALGLRGWELYRSGKMPFFHCRGVSQGDYRTPLPGGQMDEIQKRHYDYLCRKWGIVKDAAGIDHITYKSPWNLSWGAK